MLNATVVVLFLCFDVFESKMQILKMYILTWTYLDQDDLWTLMVRAVHGQSLRG